jgi:hypothetical protein
MATNTTKVYILTRLESEDETRPPITPATKPSQAGPNALDTQHKWVHAEAPLLNLTIAFGIPSNSPATFVRLKFDSTLTPLFDEMCNQVKAEVMRVVDNMTGDVTVRWLMGGLNGHQSALVTLDSWTKHPQRFVRFEIHHWESEAESF